MPLRKEYQEQFPDFPWLTPDEPGRVQELFADRGWLESGESVERCAKAGEGNMNLTLRVETGRRSMVLKQARPWVEKYDHIPAPWDRMLFEQRFYERARTIDGVAEMTPEIYGVDAEARVIVMEDLAAAEDLTGVYAGGGMAAETIETLAGYLGALHSATAGAPDPDFANREMRRLNHAHLFVVPLDPNNGLDLDPHETGLNAAATALQEDEAYRPRVQEAGDRYLGDGPCLVHADYFPGSWMQGPGGMKIIDPEFCFYGDPEVDLGVALAHFRLAGLPWERAQAFLNAYGAGYRAPEPALLASFAGVEVMRRLIGVAQLPIPPTEHWRRPLLEASRRAVLEDDIEALWT